MICCASVILLGKLINNLKSLQMYFDQIYSEKDFIEFELSLNDKERQAVSEWLNMRFIDICHYQRTGEGDKDIVELERNFSSALNKAVPCRGTVY